tara:strand:+ start:5163 stop:5426 length:264 start_codon:yes stop_codon:yes gene_type:complete
MATNWKTESNEKSASFTYSGGEKPASFTYSGNEKKVNWIVKAQELGSSFTHTANEISGVYFLTDFGFIPYWDTNADYWNTLTYAWGD